MIIMLSARYPTYSDLGFALTVFLIPLSLLNPQVVIILLMSKPRQKN